MNLIRSNLLAPSILDIFRISENYFEDFQISVVKFQKMKFDLLKALEEEISKCSGPSKIALIQIKRDVFNDRNFDRSKNILNKVFTPQILNYKKSLNALLQARKIYDKQLQDSTGWPQILDYFRKIPNIRNAILISNPDAYFRLYKVKCTNHKKLRKTVQSAHNYITRATIKVSPLSSFTSIMFEAESIKERKIKTIALNVTLQEKIEASMAEHKEINKYVITKTLQKSKDNLIIIQEDRMLADIHTIKSNQMLEYLIEKIGKDEKSWNDLLNCLIEYGCSQTDAEEVLEQLLDLGFVIRETVVPIGSPNWEKQYLNLFTNIEDLSKHAHIIEVLEALSSYKLQLLSLDSSAFKERERIILDTNVVIKKFLSNFDKKNHEFDYKMNGFFEDNFVIKKTVPQFRNREKLIQILKEYSKIIDVRELSSSRMDEMFRYFKKHFSNKKIPFIEFYQSFSKHYLSSENEEDKDYKSNRMIFRQKMNKIFKYLDTYSSIDSDVVYIDIFSLSKKLNIKYKSDQFKQSVAAAFQEFGDQENPTIVINGIGHGNGKIASRYLDFIPFQFQRELLLSNTNNGFYIDLDRSLYNNNNCRPIMTDCQINTITGKGYGENSFNLNDIQIFIKSDKLSLSTKEGFEIAGVLDLCLVTTPINRNNVGSYLMEFSKHPRLNPYLLLYGIRRKYGRIIDGICRFTPEVRIAENIIISRKTWHIGRESLIKKLKTNKSQITPISLIEQFVSFEIPKLGFYKTLNNQSNDSKKVHPSKPNFFSVNDPTSISILIKALEKTDWTRIEITEATPSPQEISLYDSGLASEIILEFDF